MEYMHNRNCIFFIVGIIFSIPFAINIFIAREITLPVQVAGELILLVLLIKTFNFNKKLISCEHIFLALFLLSSVLSIALHYLDDQHLTVTQILSFTRYIMFIMLYIYGLLCLSEKQQLDGLIDGLIVGATICTAFMISYLLNLVFYHELLFKAHQIHNSIAMMKMFPGYPNKLSALYGIIVIFILFKRKISPILIISLLLIATLLLFAMGKASLIGLGVSMIGIAIICRKEINLKTTKILVSYLVLLIVVLYFLGYFNSNTQSILPRLEVAGAAVAQSMANLKIFLFGYGYKAVQNVIPTIIYNGQLLNIGSAHNQYIEILLKTGFAGLLLIGVFVLIILIKSWRKIKEPDRFYYEKSIYFIIIGLLISNISQENFTAEPIASISMLMLGYLNGRISE